MLLMTGGKTRGFFRAQASDRRFFPLWSAIATRKMPLHATSNPESPAAVTVRLHRRHHYSLVSPGEKKGRNHLK